MRNTIISLAGYLLLLSRKSHMNKLSFIRIFAWAAVFFGCLSQLTAQENLTDKKMHPVAFTSDWISCPDVKLKEYGVFHLRKTFELSEKPDQFVVHVSGDQRYRFFVNGTPVCFGPARGDLLNWYYETVDIAKYLNVGKNVLAAQLWNMGSGAPAAQVSYQTAFILQGHSGTESIVNTNKSWRIIKNKGYFEEPFPASRLASYIIGSCDSLVFRDYPHGWQNPNFDDRDWLIPVSEPKERYFYHKRFLKPRSIPFMEEKIEPIAGIVRLSGIEPMQLNSRGEGTMYIPPHTNAQILFDIKNLTTAYPEITFSGGKDGKVKITYAESLFDGNKLKGNRNEVEGKHIRGYYDVFLPDGGTDRLFRPLWMRTFRYVQFDILTTNDPLTINKLQSVFTAYPFKQEASFTSDNASLAKIWEVGWRTARLCANETYMDCPYYEQLQYAGDTQIQALISLFVSGDDRLMRNAIEQFHQSRIPDGLTKDAYPAGFSKIIPPFSLFWVSMVHDYFWYRDDPKFVERYLVPMESVLKWFEYRIDPTTGMLGKTGFWNFVDWSFPGMGIPEGGREGNSSILSLHYAYTLEQAAEILSFFNQPESAKRYQYLARQIKQAVITNCYDAGRKLMADSPEKKNFSQHANIWSILTDCVPLKDQKATMEKVMNDQTLTAASLYYRFYFTKALKKSGLGKWYVSTLQPWEEMLALGLSTFPETTAPTVRSDCHAWSSSPCFDFLATVCGIDSETPGFKSVRIEPNPGTLTEVSGAIPHPNGPIRIRYKRTDDGSFLGEIELPENLNGHFISNGKSKKLKSGIQTVKF